ncbi:guanitoxin biosynthesis heme-dependent pre-guanitoxin N-hydroxylase GntA [Crossiella equi]
MEEIAWTAISERIGQESFTCLGARAALRKGAVRHHHYRALGDLADVERQHVDMLEFIRGATFSAKSFEVLVITFDPVELAGELEFEAALWRHLQLLHDVDVAAGYGWHAGYDSDPRSEHFAFCVGGHPFFIAGLHPGASRGTRRFAYPALVFNSHLQFWALEEHFFTMRDRIRGREVATHGSVNPSFLAYAQEARHYGGRFTEPAWQPPFVPRVRAVRQDPAGPCQDGDCDKA